MDIVESIRRITQPNAPLMQPSKQYQKEIDGRASAFLINVKPGSVAYRYDMSINLRWYDRATGRDFEKTLAKGADEGLRSRHRNLCYDLLATTLSECPGFLPEGEIIYDCKSTIYTSMPIHEKYLQKEIVFPTTKSTEYVQRYCASECTAFIQIKQNSTGHLLSLDDFRQYTSRHTIHHEDRSIRTFLEMAVAQYGLNQNTYTPIGAGKLFEQQTENLAQVGNGMVLRSGIAKGVRIVKGDRNYPVPSLVVDAKVSPFFAQQDLITTVRAIANNRGEFPKSERAWDEVLTILQNLRVEVAYDRSRTFGIRGLTKKTSKEIMVNYQDQLITLFDYFQIERGYTIRHADIPVVIPHYADRADSTIPDHYFPIEVLVVMPDQTVPLEKMSQRLSQDLLNRNSRGPEERYKDVMHHCDNLGLFSDDNPVLKAFGITILRESNKCKINVRAPPQIAFRDNVPVNVNAERAEWKRESSRKQYHTVDNIYNWKVLCHPQQEPQVRQFMGRFMEAARRRGMSFTEGPQFFTFSKDSKWNESFDKFAQEDVQFVILIDSKNVDSHGILKYYEARKKILTQHITFERVLDVLNDQRKGPQTLENILNKTNMKYSGVNYQPVFEQALSRFKLEDNDTLVIGYDIATPPPMSPNDRRMCQSVKIDLLSFDPSVIGITANMATNPHNFVGDYYYDEAKREGLNYDNLGAKFTWVLETLAKFRPHGARPSKIFVIRNGLSEGQFAESVQHEMNALRTGCAQYAADYHPKFVYVLGTKRHFKKYYIESANRIQNMVPGSVVDHKFVREDCPEFFMQSHYALKGVGKPVEYNVLVDEIGCTKDEVEGFLNSLCYTHQIINSAVSMPEPIYQADELAKRGRENYITMKRLGEPVPRVPPYDLVDMDALNQLLSYRDHPILIGTRFTA